MVGQDLRKDGGGTGSLSIGTHHCSRRTVRVGIRVRLVGGARGQKAAGLTSRHAQNQKTHLAFGLFLGRPARHRPTTHQSQSLARAAKSGVSLKKKHNRAGLEREAGGPGCSKLPRGSDLITGKLSGLVTPVAACGYPFPVTKVP